MEEKIENKEPNQELNRLELLNLLQNHSNLRTGQDQVLWSIFGSFWATNSLLLVSFFAAGSQWNKFVVGLVISVVGTMISWIWAFIQKRAIKRIIIYENAIKSIEKSLKLPFDICSFYNENETKVTTKKLSARKVMIAFSNIMFILWLIALISFVIFSLINL